MLGKISTLSTLSLLTTPRKLTTALAFGLLLGAAPKAQAQTWMVSTTPQIELSVTNSAASPQPYTAVFVVRNDKTGKAYSLVKMVEQPGIMVLFPTEPGAPEYFRTDSGEVPKTTPGRYTWECTVEGKRVGGGRFNFAEVGNDVIVRDQR
jgi:hypothetical protein